MQLGRGHTKGDTVVWLPEKPVLFSGDLVEFGATPYAGDAYLEDWPETLTRSQHSKPPALVPGAAIAHRQDRASRRSTARARSSARCGQCEAPAAATGDAQGVYRDTCER